MNPNLEHEFMRKIKRADRVIFWCMVGLLALVAILFAIILYQNQRNADNARDLALENVKHADEKDLENHHRTQELVVCVAETLTKPLVDRGNLKVCIDKAQDHTKDVK